jgi:hypothetical protein
MANPTTNYGFVLPTSTDLVTDLPADFDIALQGVDTRLKALQPGTTLGDIAYSSATANTSTRLPIGTTGQVLAVSGGVPAWTTTADVTPLTTKGDLFTFTTVDARLAVSANGETLVADSSTSSGLRYQGSMAAGRNVLINGGMDIWQRGTSFATSGVYAADRFIVGRAGGAAGGTYTRQVTGDTTNLPNIQYCIRLQRDSGNTSTANMGTGTVVETANAIPYAGKTVTMSFYARVGANFSATSSTINAYVTTGTGTDQNGILGAWTGTATPLNQNFTATTTWQRFSVTGTFASNVTEFYNYVNFTPTGTAGAADYLEVTGIQLEIGSVATPFTRTGGTLQGELAACQRYFEVMGAGSSGRIVNTTTVEHYIRFTEKRVAPSFALTTTAPQVYDPATGTKTASGSTVALTLGSKVNGTTVQTSGYSSLTAGNWAIFNDNYLQVSAEL